MFLYVVEREEIISFSNKGDDKLSKKRKKSEKNQKKSKDGTREIDYILYTALLENPRMTMKNLIQIVKSFCNVKQYSAAQRVVDNSFKGKTIVGPYLYCNAGINVTLFETDEPTQKELEHSIGIPLVCNYSYVLFSRNEKSNLQYAELVNPSFPSKVTLEGSITLDEKAFIDKCFCNPGTLEPDKPPDWDGTDLKIYQAMKNPRRRFFEVGKELQMSWKSVRDKYQKIIKDCKVFTGFFPLGYFTYSHLLVTMTTEYEQGVRTWLHGLDRSSWLFKVDNTLVLYFFTTHVNRACLKLCEMRQMGVMNGLKVALPLYLNKNPLLTRLFSEEMK